MYVNNIKLKNFRNYEKGYVEFTPGINVIYGENARGKTNILEAIYFMSTARSHRFAKESELIKIDSQNAKIEIDFNSYGKDFFGEISILKNSRKSIKMNKILVTKTSMLMNYLSAVMFCPEDLKIVKGSPGERRRVLDLVICRLKQKYFHSLSDYFKILNQRNILLKTNPKSDMLWVWDEKLAETGSIIINYRDNYIKKLNEKSAVVQREISNENLEIIYENTLVSNNISETKENFLAEIKKHKEREIKTGTTLVGPHRDDFKVIINNKDARIYASQGQQRTAALAMKIGEVNIISENLKENPVLLLDDVLSELDTLRQDYILNKIKDMQVIITCTDIEKFKDSEAKKIYIEDIKR